MNTALNMLVRDRRHGNQTTDPVPKVVPAVSEEIKSSSFECLYEKRLSPV